MPSLNLVSAAAAGGGMSPPMSVPIAGRWYSSHNGLEPGALASRAADHLHLMPVLFPCDVTLDRISIDCSVTNSANARLGLYNNASSGLSRPGTLLVESASFAISTSTGANDQTIDETLSGGTLYWACICLDAAATVRTYTGSDSGISYGGTAGDGALNTHARRAEIDHTFAALPADNSATALTIASGSNALITMRVAS